MSGRYIQLHVWSLHPGVMSGRYIWEICLVAISGLNVWSLNPGFLCGRYFQASCLVVTSGPGVRSERNGITSRLDAS